MDVLKSQKTLSQKEIINILLTNGYVETYNSYLPTSPTVVRINGVRAYSEVYSISFVSAEQMYLVVTVQTRYENLIDLDVPVNQIYAFSIHKFEDFSEKEASGDYRRTKAKYQQNIPD